MSLQLNGKDQLNQQFSNTRLNIVQNVINNFQFHDLIFFVGGGGTIV